MSFLIGITLALAVGAFARWVGLDRDRAFYPTVMIVIACLYSLFAIMADSPAVLLVELTVGAGFVALAMVGFRRSLWLVVAALALHGLFDIFHPHAFHNPGVPVWYPEFCFAYDVAAAVFLGWRLLSGSRSFAISFDGGFYKRMFVVNRNVRASPHAPEKSENERK
jgi:hypothetical protein